MAGNHRTCEICGLQERNLAGNQFYAKFPLDENRCRAWVKIVGKEDLVYLPIEKLHSSRYVCGRHFKKKDFSKTRKMLKRRAIPQLLISARPLPEKLLMEFPLHVASYRKDVTPRKKKLIKQLRKTQYTLASLKKSANLIESLPSSVLKEFVSSAIKNKNRKPQGKRWTSKNKISALAIFKRSPKTYRYLQQVMPLPSVKTLQNILKKMPMEPGINHAVLNHLKKMADKFYAKDKYCSLLFDEIALKQRLLYNVATDKVEGFVDYGDKDGRKPELADHAVVFLLQGMRKKFKQPLAFYFVKGTVSSQKLAVLIKEIISEVEKTTFKTIATVCDQGPTNMGALKLLREWQNGCENYFELDGHKIFNIYDVPHLFKSLRNNFLKHGTIQMEEKQGKWAHVKEVKEQNESFLYISKITETHVQPKYRAKMRVKYAAQILSHTVAVVLKLLARAKENEHRSNELLETGLIVEDLNCLFDVTNGSSGPDDIKKGLRENVSARTEHFKLWAEYRKKLSTLKFLSENGSPARNVKCVEGYTGCYKNTPKAERVLKGPS